MSAPLAYLNGRFLPQSAACLPLNDAGFVMGATVTDLCRTFRFRLFRWADHLRRFRHGCESARVPQPLSDDKLTSVAERLVEHNRAFLPPDVDLAVVVFATPGVVGYYLGEPGGAGDASPTLGMHTFPLPFRRYRRLFEEGATLAVPGVRHVPRACVDPRIKQRSRLHWWLAENEVRAQTPTAMALLLDPDGHVTETAAANFLIVMDGVVVSPPATAILGGISLQVTRELCRQLEVGFAERSLAVADCVAADEAMLTSTPFGLAPVRQLEERTFAAPGPVSARLMCAWNDVAGLDIGGQILAAP
jgi:branched-subunit amino acid aminotransferase/4-amino-4-deoxychorismate lyase